MIGWNEVSIVAPNDVALAVLQFHQHGTRRTFHHTASCQQGHPVHVRVEEERVVSCSGCCREIERWHCYARVRWSVHANSAVQWQSVHGATAHPDHFVCPVLTSPGCAAFFGRHLGEPAGRRQAVMLGLRRQRVRSTTPRTYEGRGIGAARASSRVGWRPYPGPLCGDGAYSSTCANTRAPRVPG